MNSNQKQIHLRRQEMELICWALEYYANAPHRDARHRAFAHHIYNKIYGKYSRLIERRDLKGLPNDLDELFVPNDELSNDELSNDELPNHLTDWEKENRQ